jgi:hypothetical protein
VLIIDIVVIYGWVPENLKRHNFTMVQGGWVMNFNGKYIVEYAPTKKELRLKLATKKYNI